MVPRMNNIGEGNYAPDPDSGELMEGNDAGWTEQDGYFEPHYYYEDGSVWLEDATGTTYIGSRDKYYIDDYGNLQEHSDSSYPNSSLEDSSLKGFLAEYYPVKGEIIAKKDLTFESYPATKYQYLTEVNEEEKNVDALVCQTDDYTFGLFVLTPSDTYDKAAEKEATELIKSIDFVYAERVDMAMPDPL